MMTVAAVAYGLALGVVSQLPRGMRGGPWRRWGLRAVIIALGLLVAWRLGFLSLDGHVLAFALATAVGVNVFDLCGWVRRGRSNRLGLDKEGPTI